MKLVRDLVKFLANKAVLSVAIGLIVSDTVLGLTKSFTDDLVLPLVESLLQRIPGGPVLKDVDLKVLGAKLKVGKFLSTMIRAMVLMLVVMVISRRFK